MWPTARRREESRRPWSRAAESGRTAPCGTVVCRTADRWRRRRYRGDRGGDGGATPRTGCGWPRPERHPGARIRGWNTPRPPRGSRDQGVEVPCDRVQGVGVESRVGIAPADAWRQSRKARGVLGKPAQGDSRAAGHRQEQLQRVVEAQDTVVGQGGQDGRGERLGQRTDLHEQVGVVAVGDLGCLKAAEYAGGNSDHDDLLSCVRGGARAAVPTGVRRRWVAVRRWMSRAVALIAATRWNRPVIAVR